MKILHVITSLQKAAGTSVFCVELCNHLAELGCNVTIAVANLGEENIYSSRSDIQLIGINEAVEDLNRWDVVHIHALWSPVLHKVAVRARKLGIPIVWSPHGMLTPWALSQKRAKKKIALLLYQYRDLREAELIHVTAPSEEEDVRKLGLKNKIVEAPLGCPIPEKIGQKSEDRVKRRILFLSRIQKKKGLLNLVHAWAKIKTEASQLISAWEVVIAGPDQEGHTEEVRSEADKLEVAESFSFVGPVYGEQKEKLYASSDLFVLPTYSENFGSVVIEALAYGVPVITTKGAPWKDLLTWKCGWWIDIGIDPLKETLIEAMTMSDQCRSGMGAQGRNLVLQRYSWPMVANKMKVAYEKLLKAD